MDLGLPNVASIEAEPDDLSPENQLILNDQDLLLIEEQTQTQPSTFDAPFSSTFQETSPSVVRGLDNGGGGCDPALVDEICSNLQIPSTDTEFDAAIQKADHLLASTALSSRVSPDQRLRLERAREVLRWREDSAFKLANRGLSTTFRQLLDTAKRLSITHEQAPELAPLESLVKQLDGFLKDYNACVPSQHNTRRRGSDPRTRARQTRCTVEQLRTLMDEARDLESRMIFPKSAPSYSMSIANLTQMSAVWSKTASSLLGELSRSPILKPSELEKCVECIETGRVIPVVLDLCHDLETRIAVHHWTREFDVFVKELSSGLAAKLTKDDLGGVSGGGGEQAEDEADGTTAALGSVFEQGLKTSDYSKLHDIVSRQPAPQALNGLEFGKLRSAVLAAVSEMDQITTVEQQNVKMAISHNDMGENPVILEQAIEQNRRGCWFMEQDVAKSLLQTVLWKRELGHAFSDTRNVGLRLLGDMGVSVEANVQSPGSESTGVTPQVLQEQKARLSQLLDATGSLEFEVSGHVVPMASILLKNLKRAIKIIDNLLEAVENRELGGEEPGGADRMKTLFESLQFYLVVPRAAERMGEEVGDIPAWKKRLVNQYVDVDWASEWYPAKVLHYDEKSDVHTLMYEDGSPETLRLMPKDKATSPDGQETIEWQLTGINGFRVDPASVKAAMATANGEDLSDSEEEDNDSDGGAGDEGGDESDEDDSKLSKSELTKLKRGLVNATVEIKWEGRWYNANVLSQEGDLHRIRYFDGSLEQVRFVSPTRVESPDGEFMYRWRTAKKSRDANNGDRDEDSDAEEMYQRGGREEDGHPKPRKRSKKTMKLESESPVSKRKRKETGSASSVGKRRRVGAEGASSKELSKTKRPGKGKTKDKAVVDESKLPLLEWCQLRFQSLLGAYRKKIVRNIVKRNRKGRHGGASATSATGRSNMRHGGGAGGRATKDGIRIRVRQAFEEMFTKTTKEFGKDDDDGAGSSNAPGSEGDRPVALNFGPMAQELEEELFKVYPFLRGGPDDASAGPGSLLTENQLKENKRMYAQQSRSMCFNLERNATLRLQLLTNAVTAGELCKMTPQEMADDDTRSKRERALKDFDQEKVIRAGGMSEEGALKAAASGGGFTTETASARNGEFRATTPRSSSSQSLTAAKQDSDAGSALGGDVRTGASGGDVRTSALGGDVRTGASGGDPRTSALGGDPRTSALGDTNGEEEDNLMDEDDEELPDVGTFYGDSDMLGSQDDKAMMDVDKDNEEAVSKGAGHGDQMNGLDQTSPEMFGMPTILTTTLKGVPDVEFATVFRVLPDSFRGGGKVQECIPPGYLLSLLPSPKVDIRGRIRYSKAAKFIEDVGSSTSKRQIVLAEVTAPTHDATSTRAMTKYAQGLVAGERAGVVEDNHVLIYLFPRNTGPEMVRSQMPASAVLIACIVVKPSELSGRRNVPRVKNPHAGTGWVPPLVPPPGVVSSLPPPPAGAISEVITMPQDIDEQSKIAIVNTAEYCVKTGISRGLAALREQQQLVPALQSSLAFLNEGHPWNGFFKKVLQDPSKFK